MRISDWSSDVCSSDLADIVPAADYGLAMAMAGDAPEGVRILYEMIHDPAATARTRQNLAYAYALAGRWTDARLLRSAELGVGTACVSTCRYRWSPTH